MSATAILQLAPGEFFGGARLSCRGHGVEVSHRIAQGPPESVVTHTHADLHFILVSGGDYVLAAGGARVAERPVLVYNPPGTTHRDHFERGRRSFFSISLEPEYAASALADTALPDAPCYLVQPAQHSIALGITGFCTRRAADLSLEGLCLELLGTLERRAEAAPRVPPRWLDRALQLLHDRFTEELSMPHIARAVQTAQAGKNHPRPAPRARDPPQHPGFRARAAVRPVGYHAPEVAVSATRRRHDRRRPEPAQPRSAQARAAVPERGYLEWQARDFRGLGGALASCARPGA